MAQKKTILIVDDDEDLRALLAEQLEAEGDFATLREETWPPALPPRPASAPT